MTELMREELLDLKHEVSELNSLLNKLISTNINVHSSIAEFLVRTEDLARNVKEMVELLEVATEIESGPTEIKGMNELLELAKEMNKNTMETSEFVKKMHRRLFILSTAAKPKEEKK